MSKEKEGEEGGILADQIFQRIAALNSDHGPVLGRLVRCLGFLVLYILWQAYYMLSLQRPNKKTIADTTFYPFDPFKFSSDNPFKSKHTPPWEIKYVAYS